MALLEAQVKHARVLQMARASQQSVCSKVAVAEKIMEAHAQQLALEQQQKQDAVQQCKSWHLLHFKDLACCSICLQQLVVLVKLTARERPVETATVIV